MGKYFKYIIISIISILFVSLGIDAADKHNNFSESIIGKIFGIKAKSPCPEDMVLVSGSVKDFCIDKFEASASEKCPYPNPQNQGQTRLNIADPNCQPNSKPKQYPWRWVSQNQAQELCARAGKRLPNNTEWFEASLGTIDQTNDWGINDCQVNKNWAEQPGKTGGAQNCKSSSGAYDMIGNVWEWVNETINNGKINNKELPKQGYVVSADTKGVASETGTDGNENYYDDFFWIKQKGLRGVARGGYWDNGEKAGKYAMYMVSPPSFAGTGIGFRCVKNPTN